MRAHRELYSAPIEERFWTFVDINNAPHACWEWKGFRDKHGYGSFYFSPGDTRLPHRVSYEFEYGTILPCIDVLHKCDNPPCVRPTHLFLGSASDNLRDARAKGRMKKVNANKLSEQQVIEVFALRGTTTAREIALRLHVTPATIDNIWGKRTWKHILI